MSEALVQQLGGGRPPRPTPDPERVTNTRRDADVDEHQWTFTQPTPEPEPGILTHVRGEHLHAVEHAPGSMVAQGAAGTQPNPDQRKTSIRGEGAASDEGAVTELRGERDDQARARGEATHFTSFTDVRVQASDSEPPGPPRNPSSRLPNRQRSAARLTDRDAQAVTGTFSRGEADDDPTLRVRAFGASVGTETKRDRGDADFDASAEFGVELDDADDRRRVTPLGLLAARQS